jgi:two-component system sensor histidine kinase KdpD
MVAWGLMLALDVHLDLANQALILILASAVGAIWWGPWMSALATLVSVLAFNVAFVPPRGTLEVDLHHHGLLLVAMLSVSWIIAGLMARLRRLAVEADLRAQAEREAAAARQQAQLQSMRNTLLSAVAHDHRTPLATIISAAGALHDQAERLDPVQRQRLSATILDEATHLARITENTLQLARLDAVGLDVSRDWESLEELIGSVLRRFRQRDPSHHLRARVEPDLPLVRCDAVLIVQLLDNLVDNALKHGGGGPVDVTARRVSDRIVVAVRDRGPGVPAEASARIFEAFQRGTAPGRGDAAPDAAGNRGTGVGLALCRAIARVHHAELHVRPRRQGGASFELSLPVEPMPDGPVEVGA